MPCLFFVDFPASQKIDSNAAFNLHIEVAEAVGLSVDKVSVHLGHEEFMIMDLTGTKRPASDVHVFVEWTARPYAVKKLVAAAIHKFLTAHNLQSDITFRDSRKGTFFVNGVLIGPEPTGVEIEQL